MALTINESLKILKEHGIMVDRMNFWKEAYAMIRSASQILKRKKLAEYSNISTDTDRFRRDVGDKCTMVNISLISDTRKFRFNLDGFRYNSSNTFHKRILRRIDSFKDPAEFANTIDQYLSLVESAL
jgi:hypothetical protein